MSDTVGDTIRIVAADGRQSATVAAMLRVTLITGHRLMARRGVEVKTRAHCDPHQQQSTPRIAIIAVVAVVGAFGRQRVKSARRKTTRAPIDDIHRKVALLSVEYKQSCSSSHTTRSSARAVATTRRDASMCASTRQRSACKHTHTTRCAFGTSKVVILFEPTAIITPRSIEVRCHRFVSGIGSPFRLLDAACARSDHWLACNEDQ